MQVDVVTHFSRMSTVVIDVPASDHGREVAFCKAAIGRRTPGAWRSCEDGIRDHGTLSGDHGTYQGARDGRARRRKVKRSII